MNIPSERPPTECQYPGCPEPPGPEDLCKTHSTPFGSVSLSHRDGLLLPNDGIFDWNAVYALVENSRKLRSTWAEREVAAIIYYMKEEEPSQDEMRERFGLSRDRLQKVRDTAKALGRAT